MNRPKMVDCIGELVAASREVEGRKKGEDDGDENEKEHAVKDEDYWPPESLGLRKTIKKALQYAAFHGNADTVYAILEMGKTADEYPWKRPFATDPKARNPCWIARERGHTHIVKILEDFSLDMPDRPIKFADLCKAISKKDWQTASRIVRSTSHLPQSVQSPYLTNNISEVPLTSWKGSPQLLLDAVKALDHDKTAWLLEHGADPNDQDGLPLWFAVGARSTFYTTLILLLDHGADPNRAAVDVSLILNSV